MTRGQRKKALKPGFELFACRQDRNPAGLVNLRGAALPAAPPALRALDVLGLEAFRALPNLEAHSGALFQGAVPIALNGGEMHKNILAVLALNKPVTLGGVKPLDSTLFLHSQNILYR